MKLIPLAGLMLLVGCALPVQPSTTMTLPSGDKIGVTSAVLEDSAMNAVTETCTQYEPQGAMRYEPECTTLAGKAPADLIAGTVQTVIGGMTAFGLVCLASNNC